MHCSLPLVSWGTGSRTPVDTQIRRCSSTLNKMVQYLHITYEYPPV